MYKIYLQQSAMLKCRKQIMKRILKKTFLEANFIWNSRSSFFFVFFFKFLMNIYNIFIIIIGLVFTARNFSWNKRLFFFKLPVDE